MRTGILLSGILLFSVGLLTLAAAVTSHAPVHHSSATSHGEAATARFMTEVRLRKLHLVRPDLIPYPIETEVYC
jgi:hypothetical protein